MCLRENDKSPSCFEWVKASSYIIIIWDKHTIYTITQWKHCANNKPSPLSSPPRPKIATEGDSRRQQRQGGLAKDGNEGGKRVEGRRCSWLDSSTHIHFVDDACEQRIVMAGGRRPRSSRPFIHLHAHCSASVNICMPSAVKCDGGLN